MALFGKKTKPNNTPAKVAEANDVEANNDEVQINEKPRICCLDIAQDDIELLRKSRLNIYDGTLGKRVKVPKNSQEDNHKMLLNLDFPNNLHEYDIIIVDLDNKETVEYDIEKHVRKHEIDTESYYFLSRFPQTVFDPKPLSSHLLRRKFEGMGNKPYLIIAFATDAYSRGYEPIKVTDRGYQPEQVEHYSIYGFLPEVPLDKDKQGKEVIICKDVGILQSLFDTYKDQITYKQTFYHPTEWKNGKQVLSTNYIPLLENINGDIVSSIYWTSDDSSVILFPQIKDKGRFLNDFLTNVAPSIFPKLFPNSTKANWKEEKDYWLPNHQKLLKQKGQIQEEYEKKLAQKEKEIATNLDKHAFLHKMLSGTDDELVNALINYLKWLGFTKVVNVDDLKNESETLEEDIQIELDEGLLIIECKGIGGTSTDSDCSQISKIKYRRCEERKAFDVSALYIVNHQKHLPPLQRQNPPFSDNQREDARLDKRGLLTTWQLFQLYSDIENDIISKFEARLQLLDYGLVEFKPKDLIFIDEPKEFFLNGKVCIVNIEDVALNVGDEIFTEKDGKFTENSTDHSTL